MKYFQISTLLIIITVIGSLGWFSLQSDSLIVDDPIIQKETPTPSSPFISYSHSSISSRVPVESTILPKTNLTVKQYISGRNMETIDLMLLSINSTHWFTKVEYKNTSSFESPFYPVISRDTVNHFYRATDYYNWFWDLDPSNFFDFWIDGTNFSENYQFPIPGGENYTVTVHNLESISLDGVGAFEAWKMSVNSPLPNFSYYEKDTGLCLSSYLEFGPNSFWYNITMLEMASIPYGYNGPLLSSTTPSNLSLLAPSSLISVELSSPFGITRTDYKWDDQTNLSTSYIVETSIPPSGGLHNLSIYAYDNVGYVTSYSLVYETDVSLAGIILNSPRNNSRIQGITQIEFTVISGNGTMLINWDNNSFNVSESVIDDKVVLLIPNQTFEIPHTLIAYVNNSDGVWTKAKYLFFVDNTIPQLTWDKFENNSVQKGPFIIILNATEDSILTYSLNGSEKLSFFLKEHENEQLPLYEKNNGTYYLYLEIIDEAGNIDSYNLTFFIHASDFDWKWDIIADETRTLDLHDEIYTYWLTLSVVSRSNQSVNFTLLTETSSPVLPENYIMGLGFHCEVPTDIIFLTLNFPLSEQLGNNRDTFPLYQWIVWDNQEWVDLETIYDQVSHSWITTNLGYSQYFALIDSGDITQQKSVKVGGGSIPAFDLPTILISICVLSIIKKVKNKCQ
jgi:hypothetical protein